MGLREHAAPLRVKNFRWFLLGEVINTAGSSMAGLALAFAVLEISDSATALGLLTAAWTLPMVTLLVIGATRPAIRNLRLGSRQPCDHGCPW